MRRFSLLVVAVAALLCGCGDNERATATRAARQEFLDAVKLIHVAQQGFVPTSDGLGALSQAKVEPTINFEDPAVKDAMAKHDIDAFRHAVLAQAAAKMNAVKDKGQTTQKVEAHRLLANLHTAEARKLRQDAMIASNLLGLSVAGLSHYLDALETTHELSLRFSDDQAPTVEKLTAFAAENNAAMAKLNTQATGLQRQIDALQAQIDQQEQARETAFRNASAKSAEAYQAKGEQQYQLYIAAIEFERKGKEADVKASELKVERDLLAAQLSLVTREVEMQRAWQSLIQTGESNAADRSAAQAKFEALMAKEIERLIGDIEQGFTRMGDTYDASVAAKMQRSLAASKKASELAGAGAAMAAPDQQISANLAVLGSHVVHLSAAADYVAAAGQLGKIAMQLDTRGRKLGAIPPSVGDLFAKRLESARAKQKEMLEVAAAAVNDARRVLADASLRGLSNKNAEETAARSQIISATDLIDSHAERMKAHVIPLADGSLPPIPAGPVASGS